MNHPQFEEAPTSARLARIALNITKAVFVLALAWKGISYAVPEVPAVVALVYIAVALPLLVVGFITGFLALFGVFRHGPRGILAPALIACAFTGINLTLIASVLYGEVVTNPDHPWYAYFNRNRTNIPAVSKTLTNDDVGLGNTDSPYLREGWNYDRDLIEEIIRKNQDVVQYVDHRKGAINVAVSWYLKDVVEADSTLRSTYEELLQSGALDCRTLKQRGDIRERRQAMQAYQRASEKWYGLVGDPAAAFTSYLQRTAVSKEQWDGYTQQVQATATRQSFTESLHAAHKGMATNMIGMLEHLDQSWGQWGLSSDKASLHFKNAEVAAPYRRFYEGFAEAKRRHDNTESVR